jgi:hypothetical protein
MCSRATLASRSTSSETPDNVAALAGHSVTVKGSDDGDTPKIAGISTAE